MLIEYWIQLENHPWDACPNHIDRLTSANFASVGTWNGRPLFKPLGQDALILRRYTANWAAPADRKVNPWDVNEPDPTDTGTKGTIPGPVIECNVGDSVKVHFRNMDTRTQTVVHPAVTHQVVHPAVTHQEWRVVGFRRVLWFRIPIFELVTIVDVAEFTETVVDVEEFTTEDLLPIEKRLHSLHTHGFVFDARFDGAYPLSPPDPGQLVGAESAEWSLVPGFTGGSKQGDRVPPNGTFIYDWNTISWPTTSGVWLYHDHSICDMENVELGAIGFVVIHNTDDVSVSNKRDVDIRDAAGPTGTELDPNFLPRTPGGQLLDSPIDDKTNPTAPVYRTPSKALYLQLFHEMRGVKGMCINGRTFLGNTPTMVAGPTTLMRFGVVGMGSQFHTFHIHGHRWLIPGPTESPSALQFGGPMDSPVSQFEDTKTFGPANSFAFTIDEGDGFMRASPPFGEWHMHCHVLMHMMTGMMGSLLVVNDGQAVVDLPMGVPCPDDMGGGMPQMTATVRDTAQCTWKDDTTMGPETTIKVNGTVSWVDTGACGGGHTVAFENVPPFHTPPAGINVPGNVTFNAIGDYGYHCSVHTGSAAGTSGMWGIVHVVA